MNRFQHHLCAVRPIYTKHRPIRLLYLAFCCLGGDIPTPHIKYRVGACFVFY